MAFPKKSCWNLIFLVLSGRIIFLFPENMILPPDGKWKMIFLKKKKYTEIWYLLQMFWKDGLFKKDRAGTWSFLYYLERWYFFSRKHGIFSLDGKRGRGDLSHEIPWNMMFSLWYVPRLPAKKKLKTILSRKNAPKGDWHSRSTPLKELQQPSVPSWRPLQTFSYIALQQKKTRKLNI